MQVASTRSPRKSLDDLGGQLAFYIRALAWTPRTIRRYKKEILRILAEVTLGSGLAGRHRRHRRRDHRDVLLHRHRGRPPGVRRAQPARHRRLLGLRLGLLQHPRDRPARRRHRPRRDRRLRVHRPARRDADLRGGRRPRGDGDPVAAVPGDHAHHRRPDRDHPAVRRGAAVVVLRDPADRHPVLRPERPAPTTTTSTSSCRPATCCGRSARCWSSR